jgi:hypothetical protein
MVAQLVYGFPFISHHQAHVELVAVRPPITTSGNEHLLIFPIYSPVVAALERVRKDIVNLVRTGLEILYDLVV